MKTCANTLAIVALVATASVAMAEIVDPDAFPSGTVLNNAYPGVTLTALGDPGVLLNSDVVARPSAYASTGPNVFGNNDANGFHDCWGDGYYDYLRVDFSMGAISVSLDFITNNSGDHNAVMKAFNGSGVEVDSDGPHYVPGPVGTYRTLTVSGPYIAWIEAHWDEINRSENGLLDHLVYTPVPEPPISVDVKPGSWPNPLNTISKGVLPLAICGTEDFDVMTIDPATILVGDSLGPIRYSYEDVATPFEGDPCEGHDLNGDGFMDLALKFGTQDLVSVLGLDLLTGQTVPLALTGSLLDGTPLTGSDCVWVLTPGDGNLDGLVDGLDYVLWANHYGTGATWGEGDFTDDQSVDGLDYVAWSNNHYAGYSPAASVPEPAALTLLALGGLALIRRRR